VGHDGFRSGQAGTRPRRRASLEVRLVVTALCLLAAGAAIITGACGLIARGYFQGQADQQLRAYAARLVSQPFKASPLYGVAGGVPGAAGPGGVLGIEVRGPAGQVVMRADPAGRPGPVIPAVPAAVTTRGDQPATVAAGGGGTWRVITEPIHYRAQRIPFSFSTEGFYVMITSTARRGLAGTLVIGLDLRNAGHAVGTLAVTVLAISGAVILAVACLAVVLSRALLRPVTQAEQTLTAAAAGQLSCRVPERHGGDTGRLAVALNTMLSQIEHASRTGAASEEAARRSRGQLCRNVADAGHQLRKPLSVVRGIADTYRRSSQVSTGELDRMMRRVADETARMAALADALPVTPRDQRPPQR
jgi:two-component system OmpR family sensor kinase